MSMRRYAILVFAAGALCAQACSSSSTKTGTGGATGSGGSTATGGHGIGGTTGVGGMVVGTGGTTTDSGTDVPRDVAMDVPADVPRDTTVIDTGTDTGTTAAALRIVCAAAADAGLMTSQPPFSADDFCTLYLDACNTTIGATPFATKAACVAAYMGYNTDASTQEGINGQKGCRTYHLCNAVNGTPPASLNTHCPHATGLLPGDAGPGGPCP